MAFAAKLTPEDVAKILSRRAAGETYEAIAKDYPVSTSRVYEICNPEKQALKVIKIKEYQARKRAEKKAEKAAAEGTANGDDDNDFSDLDLNDTLEEDEDVAEAAVVEEEDDDMVDMESETEEELS